MTGYRGRIGVYELLVMDGALADAIRREDLGEFERLAAAQQGIRADRGARAALRNRPRDVRRRGHARDYRVSRTPSASSSLLDDVLTSADADPGAADLERAAES